MTSGAPSPLTSPTAIADEALKKLGAAACLKRIVVATYERRSSRAALFPSGLVTVTRTRPMVSSAGAANVSDSASTAVAATGPACFFPSSDATETAAPGANPKPRSATASPPADATDEGDAPRRTISGGDGGDCMPPHPCAAPSATFATAPPTVAFVSPAPTRQLRASNAPTATDTVFPSLPDGSRKPNVIGRAAETAIAGRSLAAAPSSTATGTSVTAPSGSPSTSTTSTGDAHPASASEAAQAASARIMATGSAA